MESFLNFANSLVWSPVLVILCLSGGLFFSFRSRFVQIRLLREMWHLLFQKKEDRIGLSSFQALAMTLAGRVGTGNIAGVATAIFYGGPGTLFWMWVTAFLGASSAFVESTLGQIYKEKINGEYRGGPAFYIEKGLGSKVYALFFALLAILANLICGPGVQSNTIAASWTLAFDLSPAVSATVITSLCGLVIVGGLRRISQVATLVVPFMAQAYIAVVLVIVGINWQQIGAVFSLIISNAFGPEAIAGGMLGTAVSWGVRRGVYSSEAGLGTAPHASSAAAVSHPVKQGLVQTFSVYIDTLFVCSATGFMMLMTGCYNVTGPDGTLRYEGLSGVEAGPNFTQHAIDSVMPGLGGPLIATAIFFFAFTTLLAFYYIAETNIAYINRSLRYPVPFGIAKAAFLFVVAFGALKSSGMIWTMADIGVGLMAWGNIFAIILLQKLAFKALRDYEEQRARGLNPVFRPEKLGIRNAAYWLKDRIDGGSSGGVGDEKGDRKTH